MENYIDELALEFTALGLELGGLPPEQKRALEKSWAAPTRKVRLVVRSDYKFKGAALTKAQPATMAPASPVAVQPAPPTLTRAEIGYRLQKAAQEGELDVALAGQFYTQPEIALPQIPYDVRLKYHIPETLTGSAVEKSGATPDEALSLRQIRSRLLRAAQCNAVDPRVLGWFNAYPNQALKSLPFDVRKSYGLPEQLGEPLRKS